MEPLQREYDRVLRDMAALRADKLELVSQVEAQAKQLTDFATAQAAWARREAELLARLEALARALAPQPHLAQGGGGPASSTDSECLGCCRCWAGMHASLRLREGLDSTTSCCPACQQRWGGHGLQLTPIAYLKGPSLPSLAAGQHTMEGSHDAPRVMSCTRCGHRSRLARSSKPGEHNCWCRWGVGWGGVWEHPA